MFSRRNLLPALIIIVIAATLGVWTSGNKEASPPQNTAPATGDMELGSVASPSLLPTLQASPNPTGPTAPPVNVQTYEDPEGKFTIAVPLPWKGEKLPASKNESATNFSGANGNVKIIFYPAAGDDLQKWILKRDEESKTAYEGQPSKQVIKIHAVTINDVPAIQREEQWLAAGFTTLVTYMKKGNQIIVVQLEPNDEQPPLALMETYRRVANSLKIK